MGGVPIRVNVWDLTRANSIMRKTNTAVYHTSVVIDNKIEVYFGFKRNGVTGIDFADKVDILPNSMKGTLYQTIYMGESKHNFKKCKKVVEKFLDSDDWLSDTYNMLYHNCHIFAQVLCDELMGKGNTYNFPNYVYQSQKIGQKLYSSFFSMFVNQKNPPFFLGNPNSVKNRATFLDLNRVSGLNKEIEVY